MKKGTYASLLVLSVLLFSGLWFSNALALADCPAKESACGNLKMDNKGVISPATGGETGVTAECSCGSVKAKVGQYCLSATSTVYDATDGASCRVSFSKLPIDSKKLPSFGIAKSGLALLDKISLIGNWVFAVLITISVIYIILAAFQFVTGGPEKAEEARKKLIFAVIGIAVALLAAGLPVVIRSLVTV